MKVYSVIVVVGLVILSLFLFYKKSKEIGTQEQVAKEQEKIIIIQNEVIKDKKEVAKRVAKYKAIPTNDNIVWLRQEFCTDCN